MGVFYGFVIPQSTDRSLTEKLTNEGV